jgi:1,3-beta-glucanosyltransferase GAS1
LLTSPCRSTNLQDTYIETIDAFAKYDNVLAYNVGNEIVIAANGTADGLPWRLTEYLSSKSKGSSALVGYAAVDAPKEWRNPFADYLSCDISGQNSGDVSTTVHFFGPLADTLLQTSLDIYGLNNYEWCGDSTFQKAWAGTNQDYADSKLAIAYVLSHWMIAPDTKHLARV